MTEQLLAKLKIMLNFLVLERAAQNKKGKKFNCLRITACFTCKQIFHQLLKDSSRTTKFLQSIINYQLTPAQKHRRKPALLQPHNKFFSLILFSSLSQFFFLFLFFEKNNKFSCYKSYIYKPIFSSEVSTLKQVSDK